MQIEKALVPRVAATFQIFSALLEMQDRDVQASQQAVHTAAQGDKLQSEITKLTTEVSALRYCPAPGFSS